MKRRLQSLDLAPPALVFVAASVVLMMSAVAAGADFSASKTWTRWDAGIYMTIARTGYTIYPCVGGQPHAIPWCGTALLFPGYPVLLAPLYGVGLPTAATAVAVSWLFDFGVLVLLWEGFLRRVPSPARYVALVFGAFVPGGVYMRSGYPMPMAAFFMLLCLYLLRRRRWFWAALSGGLAGFTYPVALAIAPIVVVWVFIGERHSRRPARVLRASLCGAVAVAGFVATVVLDKAQTGRWDAYFLMQDNYHHGIHFPWAMLLPMLRGPFAGVTHVRGVWDCEAILATAVGLSLVIWIIVQIVRRTAMWQEVLIVVLVLVCWLGPLSQRDLSYWRDDTLLLPAAVLLPRLPIRVAIGLTGGAVTVLPLLAVFFFKGALV